MKFFKKNSNEVNVENVEEVKGENMKKEVDTKLIVKIVGTAVIGALAIGATVHKFLNKDAVDAGYSDLPATDDFSEVVPPVADESDFVGE